MLRLSPAGRRYGHLVTPKCFDEPKLSRGSFPLRQDHWHFGTKWPFVRCERVPTDHLIATAVGMDVDLEPWAGPVKDQSDLGACSGFCGAGLRELMYRRFFDRELDQTVPAQDAVFSPLFVYWWNRRNDAKLEIEDGLRTDGQQLAYVNQDRGATIRALMRTLRWQGVCLEKEDPYQPVKFRTKPELKDLDQAIDYRSGTYRRLDESDPEVIKEVLRAGFPVAAGIQVFESFEGDDVAHTGQMPMPSTRESYVGGHAVLIIGYRDQDRTFKVRNSWGKDWGDGGNFHMPYDYLTQNHVTDAWMMHPPKK